MVGSNIKGSTHPRTLSSQLNTSIQILNMVSCKFFILFILITLSFPGLDKASAAGNRRLLAPSFPGIPNLPMPSVPTFPAPTFFPPFLPSPYTDPSTPDVPPFPSSPFADPSTPNFPPTTFPSVPFPPIFPPPQTATTP